MSLSQTFKKQLRTIGHDLNPTVIVSSKSGIHDNVLQEIALALNNHELIKVKLVGEDREEKAAWATQICQTLSATLIQKVGNIILLYKKAPEQNLKLSNVVRFYSQRA
jgi:RNA-binding protein